MTPDRITWRGPGCSIVILDEDGVTLDVSNATRLEENEILALWAVIEEAKTCRGVGATPIPAPPEREPWQHELLKSAADRTVRAMTKAIDGDVCPF